MKNIYTKLRDMDSRHKLLHESTMKGTVEIFEIKNHKNAVIAQENTDLVRVSAAE